MQSNLRPPRVQMTFDRKEGDYIVIKELPFVIGVLANFSGIPSEPLPPLHDRRFVHVTPENLDRVISAMKPRLVLAVSNKLSEDPNASALKVELRFQSMDDFSPESVAHQLAPTRELLRVRQRLLNLRSYLNPAFDDAIQSLAWRDPESLRRIAQELSADPVPEDGLFGEVMKMLRIHYISHKELLVDI